MEQPPSSESHDAQLAQLLADLTDRAQAGRKIDIDSECAEHPEIAVELRDLWNAVLVADVIGSAPPTGGEIPAPGAALSLELPCRWGDYELLEEIGRGGMGVVYRANQLSLQRTVAVKMILRGQLASTADHERFQAEAESAAKLDHSGIVPVYEVGQLEGHPYFSMKYVSGVTLAEMLANGPLPARESARLMSQVSHAIHFAHESGVLHRDLKPSNILIDDGGQPHVTDFGLAKQTHAATLTRTGAILGTPSYMSPEQAAGERTQVGPSSDVYSLGSVLYHLLTGRPPFQAATPFDIMVMLREQDVVPPRIVNPSVNRDLEMIALRCLQKPADLRYATAADLAADLDAFLRDEPIAARSGRFAEVLGRFFRETHHATVLENWGLLWMWHSLALLIASLLTNALHEIGFNDRWYYIALWTAGLGTWAAVFWWLRRRMGPVTFVERQIAHVWAASMLAIGLLFYIEIMLNLPVLALSPVVGLIAGMVFVVKAGILSGSFYFQAAVMFVTAFGMARFPRVGHLIFGVAAASCFFFPGLKYYRQRVRSNKSKAES